MKLTGGPPIHPLVCRVFQSHTMESFHDVTSLGEVTSGISVVAGAPEEIDAFVQSFSSLHLPPHILDVQLLETAPRRVAWYTRWRRPTKAEGVSVEHVALDHLGAGAFVRLRVRPGEIQVRLASERPDALDRCVRSVENHLAGQYAVRRLYAGDLRVEEDSAPLLAAEDAGLLRTAVRLGYYDSPRRATLEDVSRAAGRSKSTICERLKVLEGRAITAWLDRGGLSSPPAPLRALPPSVESSEESLAGAFAGK